MHHTKFVTSSEGNIYLRSRSVCFELVTTKSHYRLLECTMIFIAISQICFWNGYLRCHLHDCAVTSVLRILVESNALIRSVYCTEMATQLSDNWDLTYVVFLFRVQAFCPLWFRSAWSLSRRSSSTERALNMCMKTILPSTYWHLVWQLPRLQTNLW